MKTSLFRQRKLETSIHIISWLLIFSFPLMFNEWGNQFDTTKHLRHYIVPVCSFLTFYINYLFLIPHSLFRNDMRRFLFYNGILILSMGTSIHLCHSIWFAPSIHTLKPQMPPPLPYDHWIFLGRDLLMMTGVACLSTGIRVSIHWQRMEERLTEIEQQKAEAELKNLKNQLNPHFLLNTLNNIYALIAFNREKAQEAVLELSKLLRHVLYDNQSALVPLEKELDFINNYLSLMRIRLSKSVEIKVKLDPGPRTLQIAPLIFISLIENAFKHGISPTKESFIYISITGHEDGRICCEISNSNFPKSRTDKSGSGIGLEQVYQRLELSYPNQYKWQKGTSTDGSTYTSSLTIQSSAL